MGAETELFMHHDVAEQNRGLAVSHVIGSGAEGIRGGKPFIPTVPVEIEI